MPGPDPRGAPSLVALLASAHPAAFGGPARPLKVGIHRDVAAAHPEAGAAAIQRALGWVANRPPYLEALALGRGRVDLDGRPAGEPDEAQRRSAAARLALLLGARDGSVDPRKATPEFVRAMAIRRATPLGRDLAGADMEFVLSLFARHPRAAAKTAGVEGVGVREVAGRPALVGLRRDGGAETFNLLKCLPQRPDPDDKAPLAA